MTDRTQELRGSADEELVGQLREAKEELFNLRFQVATGQLDNNRRLQVVRRDIARIYTVMRERELGIVRGSAPAGQGTAADGDETAAAPQAADAAPVGQQVTA